MTEWRVTTENIRPRLGYRTPREHIGPLSLTVPHREDPDFGISPAEAGYTTTNCQIEH